MDSFPLCYETPHTDTTAMVDKLYPLLIHSSISLHLQAFNKYDKFENTVPDSPDGSPQTNHQNHNYDILHNNHGIGQNNHDQQQPALSRSGAASARDSLHANTTTQPVNYRNDDAATDDDNIYRKGHQNSNASHKNSKVVSGVSHQGYENVAIEDDNVFLPNGKQSVTGQEVGGV